MSNVKQPLRLLALSLTAASVLVSAPMVSATTVASVKPAPSVTAAFEGRLIGLADGWGEARACTSDGVATRCYRSEEAMDVAENVALDVTAAATLACSGSLRLYRLSGFGGGVLQLTTQFTVINLASYGFDNDTSSYRVGPCNSSFYDTTTGGTGYPGNTSANVSATSMVSGWDNRVGSVYIS